MKEEIKKNIDGIRKEDDRINPSGVGFDFEKENERVRKMTKDKKERKVKELKEKKEKLLYTIAGVFMAYFVLFSAFWTYSMINIQKNAENILVKNEQVKDIDKTKPVLFVGSQNNVKVNVYKVEQEADAYKINYAILNDSDKEIGIDFSGMTVVREDDLNLVPGLQFNSLKKDTLSPGEAVQGFVTFFKPQDETPESKEPEGYFTSDENGKVIFVETDKEEEAKDDTEKESKEDDKKEDESSSIDVSKMDIKLMISFVNYEGVFNVITEINR